MKFRDDYGVYVCPHVFQNKSDVLESIRDIEGCWQFFCDDPDCPENNEPHLVGVGHLIDRDETINELTILKPGMFAERKDINTSWAFGELDE